MATSAEMMEIIGEQIKATEALIAAGKAQQVDTAEMVTGLLMALSALLSALDDREGSSRHRLGLALKGHLDGLSPAERELRRYTVLDAFLGFLKADPAVGAPGPVTPLRPPGKR